MLLIYDLVNIIDVVKDDKELLIFIVPDNLTIRANFIFQKGVIYRKKLRLPVVPQAKHAQGTNTIDSGAWQKIKKSQ